jgi:hypothetical protein
MRWTSVLVAALLLVTVLELVRRRQLPSKYAALWLVTGVGGVLVAAVPAALNAVARVLHVYDPVNLLLFAGVTFLLLVCMHLSWECGRLEEETRTIAEQLALLSVEVHQLSCTREPQQAPQQGPQQGPQQPADGARPVERAR